MKILTIKEGASLLKIDKFTAYKYAKEGIIPAIRVGRNWRFSEEVLEEWLTNKAGKDIGAWHRKKPKKKEKILIHQAEGTLIQ